MRSSDTVLPNVITKGFINGEPSSAVFSSCRKFRYVLWRRWDTSKPIVMFIGLNPSTANEERDDPTIRKVIKFAKSWGYGAVCMVNLYSYITPYPEALVKDDNQLHNSLYIQQYGFFSDKVVFAWGNFKEAREREKLVSYLFPRAMCLGLNKNGSPKHPLYIPGDTKLIAFSAKTIVKDVIDQKV